MDLLTFEKSVYDGIPIAQELGVRIRAATSERALLFAPLGPNRNHKQTAFGGSIYSVAVLSCWALTTRALELALLETDYAVVQNGSIDYLLPIGGDFTAESSWKDGKEHDRFIGMLRKRGVGRATLQAEMKVQGKLCARFTGRFAVQLIGDANESKAKG